MLKNSESLLLAYDSLRLFQAQSWLACGVVQAASCKLHAANE